MRSSSAAQTRRPEARGMWFGFSDDLLPTATVRPEQFQDIWSHSAAISPERSLALAVLEEALNDLTRYRFAKRRRGQRLYWQAYLWVASDDREWPFAFANLCDGLGLQIEPTRRQLLEPMVAERDAAAATLSEREVPLSKAA